MVIPVINSALGTIPTYWLSDLKLGKRRTSGDHPDYNIIKIDQNNEKCQSHSKRM